MLKMLVVNKTFANTIFVTTDVTELLTHTNVKAYAHIRARTQIKDM